MSDGNSQPIPKARRKTRGEEFLERVEDSSGNLDAMDVIVAECRESPPNTNTLRKALKMWAEKRERQADLDLELSLGT